MPPKYYFRAISLVGYTLFLIFNTDYQQRVVILKSTFIADGGAKVINGGNGQARQLHPGKQAHQQPV